MQREGVLMTAEWAVEASAFEASRDLPLYSSKRRRVHGYIGMGAGIHVDTEEEGSQFLC